MEHYERYSSSSAFTPTPCQSKNTESALLLNFKNITRYNFIRAFIYSVYLQFTFIIIYQLGPTEKHALGLVPRHSMESTSGLSGLSRQTQQAAAAMRPFVPFLTNLGWRFGAVVCRYIGLRMVAHKWQPSSKDQAHHTDTTTTPHYFFVM